MPALLRSAKENDVPGAYPSTMLRTGAPGFMPALLRSAKEYDYVLS
jgi:hypothetical protein